MQRWGWLLLVLCAAAGCDDDATAPTNPPLVFSATLSAANEVPPVSNAESSARGAVQVTIFPTRDSTGAITAATADFHVQVTGLPNDTTFVGAHIHPGVAGVNGPVAVNTMLSAGTPPAIVNGTATWDFRGINVAPATAQQIESNPSAFYFNVHSFSNPAGVARGQLQRVQ